MPLRRHKQKNRAVRRLLLPLNYRFYPTDPLREDSMPLRRPKQGYRAVRRLLLQMIDFSE